MTEMSRTRGPDPEVSDAEIVQAIKAVEWEAANSVELADALGMTTQGLNTRLKKLESREVLESKHFGNGKGWRIAQG